MGIEQGSQTGPRPSTLKNNALRAPGSSVEPGPGERSDVARHVANRVTRRMAQEAYRRRFLLAGIAALMLLGVGSLVWRMTFGAAVAATGVLPVQMAVQALEARNNRLVVVLKEQNGARRIDVPLQDTESRVIAVQSGMRIQGEQPKEYDLMRDIVSQLGGRVEHVIVHEATRTQSFANVVLAASGVDRRVIRVPSGDGVALALTTGASIFVEEAILAEFGQQERN